MYERYRIALLLVNCMLLLSTISLNGISIITIRKSSQLKSKVCYFVILLQSIVVWVLEFLAYHFSFLLGLTISGFFELLICHSCSLSHILYLWIFGGNCVSNDTGKIHWSFASLLLRNQRYKETNFVLCHFFLSCFLFITCLFVSGWTSVERYLTSIA